MPPASARSNADAAAKSATRRPPLPAAKKLAEPKGEVRPGKEKKKVDDSDATDLASKGLPTRLPEKGIVQSETRRNSREIPFAREVSLSGNPPSIASAALSPVDASESVPCRRVRYEEGEKGDAAAAGTHSWPLAMSREDRDDQKRVTMFFLDPAQLLEEIGSHGKKKEPEEDDEEEVPVEDSKSLSAAATASTPPLREDASSGTKEVRRRSSFTRTPGDNEYIQVAVRIRPFLKRNEGERNTLSVDPDNQVTLESKGAERKSSGVTLESKGAERKSSGVTESPLQGSRDAGTRTFKFDFVLDSRGEPGDAKFASQETVYETIGQRIVRCALDGYNACLFAYGQTGTGKTHTVLGDVNDQEKRGLLPRILEGLFTELDAHKEADSNKKSSLQISYLEIFNEHIHDLLVPPKVGSPREALQVRYHPTLGVMINDLTQSSASNIDEAMELVNFGTRMRSIASTSMNHRSSRAHTVLKEDD